MQEVGSSIYYLPSSGCTLAVMAITSHNQKALKTDPACLLGSDSSSFQIVAVNATAGAQHELS